ncbi:hypothetical protein [Streptomyces sp. NBRC 109706]|uniref:hypothetical protein n=1 Tax=Streptomyces sp. NBRC 109706 TaxID=1550035 RepID=UPI000AFF25A2|nr:hypothetical protein [Streptomyces sp. NBRC 109706]
MTTRPQEVQSEPDELAIAREAEGSVQVRAICERLSLDASVRGKLEPSRVKVTKLAEPQLATYTL